MGRRNAEAKMTAAAVQDDDSIAPFTTVALTPRPSAMGERSVSDDLQAMETSRVFWRTGTSFSEAEDDDTSAASASVLVLEPTSAKAESLRQRNQELLEVPVEHQKSYTVVQDKNKKDVYVEVDLEKYMAAREMTPLQERWNALTMIPQPLICMFYVLSGNWISKELLAQAVRELEQEDLSQDAMTAAFENNSTCMNWSNTPGVGWLFSNIHALPPLSVLVIVFGVIWHAPWSFIYHWRYAHRLSPTKRTDHWSRRMDQAMLHVSSCLTCFGTSGFLDFFLVNVIFNADSIYRQFESKVRPKRNQMRLAISIAAWMMPVVRRGDWDMLFQLIMVVGIGMFLFVRYPIGGWSHAAFHLCLIPLMPLLMEIATSLPASQDHLHKAARCFALAQHH